MTPENVQLDQALPAAREKLEQLARADSFPDLRASIDGLRQAIDALQSKGPTTADDDVVRKATESVTHLYRSSMTQANAAPQKYQQPVFQCYSDFQKCTAKKTAASEKALCVALFVLSLANRLLSLSIKVGGGNESTCSQRPTGFARNAEAPT